MADSHVDVSKLDGMFKRLYADESQNLIPEGHRLIKEIEFMKDQKLGDAYHQHVILGLEHGFAYGGNTGSAFALADSISAQTKDANIKGHEMVLRSTISVGAVSRASNGTDEAFMKATSYIVESMYRSFARRLEVQLLYGQSGIGEVLSADDSADTITINLKDWAPGIWAGAENMKIDIYTAAGDIVVANLVISAVDFDTRTISFSGSPDLSSVAATNVIYYAGAKGNEFAGIDAIIRNTGSLFGINASSYSLWKGNVLGNSGTGRNISLALIESAVVKSMEKGLVDQDVIALISPAQWSTLITEANAKRQYDQSYNTDKAVAGHKTIEFYSQNGMIKVMPSIYVKQGSCYVLPMDEFARLGSSDITFEQPGYEGKFFRLLEGYNGYELRAYTDQALLCKAPGKCAVLDDVEGA